MILRPASLVVITLLGIATAPLSRAADSKGATGNHQPYDDEEIAKAGSDFYSSASLAWKAVCICRRLRRQLCPARGHFPGTGALRRWLASGYRRKLHEFHA